MSLKHFHLVFIAMTLGLMAFLGYWSSLMGSAGSPRYGVAGCALAGFGAGLAYLAWFLRKYRALA